MEKYIHFRIDENGKGGFYVIKGKVIFYEANTIQEAKVKIDNFIKNYLYKNVEVIGL